MFFQVSTESKISGTQDRPLQIIDRRSLYIDPRPIMTVR